MVAQEGSFDVEGATAAGAREGGGEFVESEGLGEVVAGADPHGFDRGVDGGVGRHHYDDGVGVLSANAFEQTEAAALGEFEVEQKDIDGAAGEDEAGSGYGFGDLGGIAEVGGDLGAGAADGSVIVDHQDAELGNAFAFELAGGGWRGGFRCEEWRG